jgi:predicted TIM-barrel fold metal-dependent hydrolase
LTQLAERRGLPTACVGQAWFDRRDVAEVLAGQAEFPLMSGIRHKPAAVDDPREARRGAPGSMDDPVWRRGYGLLAEHADRSAEGLAAWRAALETVAARDNVALKISGLGLPGRPWTVAGNGPVVRDAIAIFGVDRCMFASNFPVDSLVGDFRTIFSGYRAITADFPPEEIASLFHDNAVRYYRLHQELLEKEA